MGIIRNSIDVVGITPENQLPKEVKGQLIEYAETEDIDIPKEKAGMYNILQINIKAHIKSNRIINTSFGKIIVLDGVKKLKIMYTEGEYTDKANIVNLKLPFNTFIELSKEDEEIDVIKVYIMDAYFELIDERKLYSHIIYLVDVHYKTGENEQKKMTVDEEESSYKNNKMKNILTQNDSEEKVKIEFVNEEEELQEITITKQNFEQNKNENKDKDEMYMFTPVSFNTVDINVPINDIYL